MTIKTVSYFLSCRKLLLHLSLLSKYVDIPFYDFKYLEQEAFCVLSYPKNNHMNFLLNF